MTSPRARRGVRAAAAGLALASALVFAPAAFAHAAISPPVAKIGVLQQFTLAVPTEKQGATTTSIELTVPSGVAVDSFEPEPGWKRQTVAQASGSGGGQRFLWTGGHVPTEEDAVFRFQATLTGGARDYVFEVRQTYSDGTVVDWSGPESSDTPSPVVQGASSLGSGSNTLLVVAALVVGALGLLVGIVALVAGRRPLT
jgi:uncharacterized protein YcnI